MKKILSNWKGFLLETKHGRVIGTLIDDDGTTVNRVVYPDGTKALVRTDDRAAGGQAPSNPGEVMPRPGSKIRVENQNYGGKRSLYRGWVDMKYSPEFDKEIPDAMDIEEGTPDWERVLVIPGGQFTFVNWLAQSGDSTARKIMKHFGGKMVEDLESESLYAIYDVIISDWARSQGFDAINFTDKIDREAYEERGEILPMEQEWVDLKTGKWWTDDESYAKDYMDPRRYTKIKSRKDSMDRYLGEIGGLEARLNFTPGSNIVDSIEGGPKDVELTSIKDMMQGVEAQDIRPGETENIGFGPVEVPGSLKAAYEEVPELVKYHPLGLAQQVGMDVMDALGPEKMPISAKPKTLGEFERQMAAKDIPVDTYRGETGTKPDYTWTEQDDLKYDLDAGYKDYIKQKYNIIGEEKNKNMKSILNEWKKYLKEETSKEEIKDEVEEVLKDEGGAAGLEPIEKAVEKLELPDGFDLKDFLKGLRGVGQHEEGDYILEDGEEIFVKQGIEIYKDAQGEDEDEINEAKKKKKKGKKDACYHKVRARYDVWPSAYASGALVKCRKVGAANWGNKSKKNESIDLEAIIREEISFFLEEKKKKRKLTSKPSSETSLKDWFKRKGEKGEKGGWVDCNTCRKDKETGKKTCKACGRSEGEERAKYPSCRPTPTACGKKGEHGKKSKAGKKG